MGGGTEGERESSSTLFAEHEALYRTGYQDLEIMMEPKSRAT